MNSSSTFIAELRKPKVRIFDTDIAVFDLSMTLLGSYLVSKQLGINPYVGMATSIPIGYATHKLFGVSTPLNNKIDSVLLNSSTSAS